MDNPIRCPSCGLLVVGVSEKSANTPFTCLTCGVRFFSDKGTCTVIKSTAEPRPLLTARITTGSGTRYEAESFLLFDARAIQVAQSLEAASRDNMRGFSSGIGMIGSITDVIAFSVVSGVVEGAISNAMAKTGQKQAAEAYQCWLNVRRTGKFFPLGAITNVRVPVPNLWVAFDGNPKGRRNAYAFNGDAFVAMRLTSGEVTTISWEAVEEYRIVESSEQPHPVEERAIAEPHHPRLPTSDEQFLADLGIDDVLSEKTRWKTDGKPRT